MVAQSEEEVENWKASLLRAGVYPQQTASTRNDVSNVIDSVCVYVCGPIVYLVMHSGLSSLHRAKTKIPLILN